MTAVALVPLDERPVNVTLPQMAVATAGAECRVPPAELLASGRTPADRAGLADWLLQQSQQVSALVVCLDTLAYGGLIGSRISDQDTPDALSGWQVLDTIHTSRPDLPIFAVSVITRAANQDDAGEEPQYWQHYGRRLHALGGALHRRHNGVDHELSALIDQVPAATRTDYLSRRLRNHELNLEAIRRVADGTLTRLLITSDDTAAWSAGSLEDRWLRYWVEALELDEQVLLHPGADEVGICLSTRAVLAATPHVPTVRVHVPVPGGDRIAPFENRPIIETAHSQVQAAGAQIVDDGPADLHLVINPPSADGAGWHSNFVPDPAQRPIASVVQTVTSLVADGQQVAVADTRYANGADPVLVDELVAGLDPRRLAGYAGWNTAGNTLGAAIGHGLAWSTGIPDGRPDPAAHRRLIAHRLLEDRCYQAGLRGELETWLLERGWGNANLDDDQLVAAQDWLTDALDSALVAAPWGAGLHLQPESVQLPWRRTFEADFTLVDD